VHNDPDRALSDGMQSLFPDQFDALMVQVRQIAAVLGRTIPDVPESGILAGVSRLSNS
jgi:3-deoxy-7-phosphoheptulonate synthase